MQLLTVVWVSFVWAILAVSMLFHAEHVMRSAVEYARSQERDAALEAVMRAACIRYQTDSQLQQEVATGKQVLRRWEFTRFSGVGKCRAEVQYLARGKSALQIYCTLFRGTQAWVVGEHLFPARR